MHHLLIYYMAMAMIACSPITFIALIFIPTPYGRNSDRKFGILIPAKIAWLIQELPAFIIPLGYIISLYSGMSMGLLSEPMDALFLLVPFTIHYFQRAVIYPLLIRGGKPTPFIPFALALTFCAYNGYLQASYAANYAKVYWDITSVVGLSTFAIGMLANLHSDSVLRNLRRPGETGYKIPYGGLFNFVSGANFLAEITEWWGYAIYTRSLPAVAFALFTTANTAPRAWHHHNWYRQKFGSDYPSERKAIIPFLI